MPERTEAHSSLPGNRGVNLANWELVRGQQWAHLRGGQLWKVPVAGVQMCRAVSLGEPRDQGPDPDLGPTYMVRLREVSQLIRGRWAP